MPNRSKSDQIEEHLEEADEACESANLHEQVGLAKRLFEALESMVGEKDQVALAGKIAEAIIAHT